MERIVVKKILNDPMEFVKDSLEGVVLAHSDKLRLVGNESNGVIRKDAPIKGKVAIATGGGYGHLPLFLGYVGEGLADGVSVGNVFTSPSTDAMYDIAKEIDGGEGVFFLYGNYFGDKMNFDLAVEMLDEEDNILVESVRISDDIASASRENWKKRRGVAGIFFAYKVAGSAAEKRLPLSEVKRITEKTAENIATMGVAISSCTIPASGKPTFELGENEIEIGMGIHGEPGIERTELKKAKEITHIILPKLIEDLSISGDTEVAVLINGSGATPLEELYIVYKEVHHFLTDQKIKIFKSYVGEYATSLEMGGFSITLFKLDGELKEHLKTDVNSPFIKQVGDAT
jgi:phosphoenolpyruvate---glycerone phosphotransferase subunit DhaK